MVATLFSFTPSTVSASRASLCSRRGNAPFGLRQTICRSHLRDAQPCEIDLLKGVSLPAVAGLTASLSSVAAARAEEAAEVTTAVAATANEAVPAATTAAGGLGTGEAVLLLTPVLVYTLFNLYRDRINPQAKFLDYIYIMAALAIFGNIFSILIFKTRFF
ncbi:hypothetical protein Vretimale_15895 [Volvox reticuliferus]|uniref:Uncharacterized protein n=1 Tax=Volvox reticuliferus TaxID=1737510 RepID=A0A8J4LWS8_9CHLO|nr:hypothetical protein Vretifemale_12978 [Volvox reticuliferus]GIM12720.1 hypothetical protein Vretimale_15895 [Volvox reticuliferus]